MKNKATFSLKHIFIKIRNNKNPFFSTLFAILFLFVIGVFCFNTFTNQYNYSKSNLEHGEKIPYNKGWNNKHKKNITLDYFTKDKGFSTKRYNTYYKKIDSDIVVGNSLCFRSLSTDIKLYIDGKLILDTPYKKNPLAVKSPGSIWNFYRFKSSDIGKTLTIKIKPIYDDNACYISDMYVCDSGIYVYDIVAKNSLFFIFATLLFIIGVIFIISNVLVSNTQNISSNSLLYVGCFSIALGMYSLTTTHLLELIWNNSQAIQTLSCMSIYLFIIPALLFVDNLLELRPKKPLYLCQLTNIILFITALILQLTDIADFHESLLLSHINLGTSITTCLVLCLIKNRSSSKKTRLDNSSNEVSAIHKIIRNIIFSSTSVCFFIDIVSFIKGTSHPGFYSSCNIVLIIIYLAYISVNNLFYLSNNAEHAKFVKQLAYKDGLTGIGNRTAYKEKIQYIKDHINSYKTVGIIIFDVNDLKLVNDSYGHIVGDELIIDVANLIKQSFTEKCISYRIGGDEFAVIIEAPNSEAIYKVSIMQFNVNMHNHNMFYNKDYTISVAHGSAFYRNNKNITFDEIIKIADKNMYENKKDIKNKNN